MSISDFIGYLLNVEPWWAGFIVFLVIFITIATIAIGIISYLLIFHPRTLIALIGMVSGYLILRAFYLVFFV